MYLLKHFIYSTRKTGTTNSGVFFGVFFLFDLVFVRDIETLAPVDEVHVSALLGYALSSVDPLLGAHREQPRT